ncbi:hypothetical protein H3M14_08720 [Latilactobacillus sakei]|uniref:hypothetical protein n=1 Tax=Latilactobacillus sakei TaxID=1599 RepID=UPI0015F6C6D1|nr:hypothetical protein [Latilactobacillus sakei]QMU86158.1 hypothetical protein H3M14_08720 [Latilactobacillus sakei]
MKKSVKLLELLTFVLLVSGCSKIKDVDTSKSTLVTTISGETKSDKVYWKTDSDGVNTASVKNSNFNIQMPNTLSKYSIKLSDSKDFKNSKSIDIAGVKPLISYPKFSDKFNSYTGKFNGYDLSNVTVSEYGSQGLSDLYKSDEGNVIIRGTIDDDKLVGLSLTALLMNGLSDRESAETSYSLGLISEALGSDYKVVFKGLDKTLSKGGQKITVKSKGTTYEFNSKKGSMITIFIHK